jgi:sulfopyruvate decarboxylase TPP-binding subunit
MGNSMVALTTFAMAYHMPMLILAIRRAGLGDFNSAVHNFSEHAVRMVESMSIKAFVLDYRVPLAQWPQAIVRAQEYVHLTHRPVVVFLNLKE